ncbi:hypothetical protein [Amycolatopsis sp. H20-H5]|uniref:hypothetical protein n=1 Tax=Amycolatopsis sp. H20-H5 TaxID=3046309 RepID=UPI002DBB7AD7|nr:hypothetical protein [Amycolatopsis sp. H20-H5]MEC3980962.1 hypothetical protein [Amycolatopsis sp. H20-H5]
MTANNPMLRFGDPGQIAKTVAFLTFDVTYTTGAEFAVDGGASQLCAAGLSPRCRHWPRPRSNCSRRRQPLAAHRRHPLAHRPPRHSFEQQLALGPGVRRDPGPAVVARPIREG